MGSPKDPCFKPNNPFLSFIPSTTTSTTTAPDIDYFVLPNSGASCPQNIDCNTCGYFVFPIGDKYSKYNDGSRIRIIKENDNYIDKRLVHNKNAIITNSEKLITSTDIVQDNSNINIKEIYLYIDDLFAGSSKINYDSEKSFTIAGGNQYWLDTNILLQNNETCIISSSGTYNYYSDYKGGSLLNVLLGKMIECDGGIITPDGRHGECDGCSFDINLPTQSLIGRLRDANYYTELGQDMLDINVNFTNSNTGYTKPFLVGSKKILTNSYFPSGYLQLRQNDACIRYNSFSTPFYSSVSKIQNNTPNNFSINNVIKATIKIKDTDIIIAQKYIGSPNSQLTLSRNNILNKPAIIFDGCDIVNKNIDLSNQKIVVELSSICESINSQTANKCCDQLPSLSLTNNKSNIVCNLPPLSVLYYNPFTNVNQNNFNNLIYTDNISLINPYFASSWSSNQQFNINTDVLSINQVNDSNNIYDFYINTRSDITSSGFLSLEYIRFWNKTTSVISQNYTISIYDSDSYPFTSYIKDNFIGSGTISSNGEISNLIPSNHTLPLYTQYFSQYGITAGKKYLIRIQIDQGTPNSTISIDDFALYGYYLNSDQYKFLIYQPSPPINLTATSYNGYVILDWEASQLDGYLNTIQYFVEYSSDNGITWSVYNQSFTDTSATINNLINGNSYIFRVRSLSEFNNYSDYSETSNPVIPLLVTNSLSQPQNLNGTAGDQKVTLYWDAPVLNTGGTITDYLIQYSINNGQDWIIYTDSISSNTSATINNLQNNINYIFRVAAKNNNGYGPFSQSSIAIKPSSNVSNKLGTPTVNFPPDILDGVSISEATREEGIFSIKGTTNSLLSLEFTNILTNTKITKLIGSNGQNQSVILSSQDFNSLLSNFPTGEIILNVKQIDINNILLDSDISSYNLRFILNTTTTTTTTTPPSFTIPKNGDFELGEDGIIGYGGGHATYWSYSDVNILSLSSYPEFSNDPRNRFVDLHYKKKGYIEQTIPTISGYTYTIEFKLGANNVDERNIVKLLKASANNQYSYYNFIPSSDYGSYNQIGWQTKTFTFIANGLTTNLRFESDCNLCKNYGPAIDDVKLISVIPPPPPPTTTTTTLLPTTTTTTTTTLAPICCDWDGNYTFVYETIVSGIKLNINEPLYFVPIRFADQSYPFNIWETYKELPCGDTFYGKISCDTSLPSDNCLEKWNFFTYQLTCGNNWSYVDLSISGYLEPCNCNNPPVFKFIGTNTEHCNCQPEPSSCIPGTGNTMLLNFENSLYDDGTAGMCMLAYPDLPSVITNTQSKYGFYSATTMLDQFIYATPNSFFSFGIDDFSIETWIYLPTWGDGAVTIYDGYNIDNPDPVRTDCFYWQLFKDSYSYPVTITENQNTSLILYNNTQYWFNTSAGYTIPLNTWVLHSLIRKDGHFYWYVNGSLVGSTLVDWWSPVIFDGITEILPELNITSQHCTIGILRDAPVMNPLLGYLDEFQIIKGQAIR